MKKWDEGCFNIGYLDLYLNGQKAVLVQDLGSNYRVLGYFDGASVETRVEKKSLDELKMEVESWYAEELEGRIKSLEDKVEDYKNKLRGLNGPIEEPLVDISDLEYDDEGYLHFHVMVDGMQLDGVFFAVSEDDFEMTIGFDEVPDIIKRQWNRIANALFDVCQERYHNQREDIAGNVFAVERIKGKGERERVGEFANSPTDLIGSVAQEPLVHISDLEFDDEGYLHFRVEADGYSLEGLYRLYDPANGPDMTLVSIDYGSRHPIIARQWERIEKALYDITWKRYREILDKSPDFKEVVIQAMEAAGYTYDVLESHEGWERFYGEGGVSMGFDRMTEAAEWLDGVVFDDPETSRKVEEIMHPERFAQEQPVAVEEVLANATARADGVQNREGMDDLEMV